MTPPRPVFRLTRPALFWGFTGGLLAGIGWFKGINLMLLIGYFLLGLMFVNAVVARQMVLRVAVRRRPVPTVFAGERVPHVLDVSAAGDRPSMVLLTDTANGQTGRWLLAPLRPGRPEVLRTTFTFAERGLVPIGPAVATSAYPLGLVEWSVPVGPGGDIAVLPAPGRVGVDELRRFVARSAGGESRSRRPARRPTPGVGDVRGVRPYRTGDGPRDIHWRTTARRGQLVVREYDQTDPLNLVVILDPWLPTNAAPEDRRRFEWAVAVVVSVGWAWATADEPGDLTLVVPGPEFLMRSGRATTGFVRDAFAPLAGITGAETVPGVPPEAVRPNAARTARLVVSPRPDSPVLAGLRRAGFPAAGADAGTPPAWYLPAPGSVG